MAEAIKKSGPGVPAPKELLDSPGVTAHDGPVRGVCAGEREGSLAVEQRAAAMHSNLQP